MTDEQKSVWTRLYEKGFWYWFRAALFTALGVLVGQLIGKADIWREVRYKIYHFQTTKLHPSHPHDLQVAFVLIGDDEYWTGPLARRVPLKRDYLARLLRAVERAHPAVIALDFELRSPTPDGTIVENPEYSAERSELLRAIRDVAERRPIVVPTLLESSMSKHGDAPHEVSNIFGSDLGTARNIFPGYIRFAPDLRMIPSRVSVEGRDQPVDSFAFGILHAYAPEVYSALTQGDGQGAKSKEFLIRFGSFRDEQAFGKVSFSAKDVLAGKSEALRYLEHRIVLLGGRWHRDGLGVGPWTDEHLTPAGRIVGVYTHANYVEALRVGEYYPQVSEAWTISLEVLLILAASIVLALDTRKWHQLAATILPSLLILILSYVFLQNLGFFFECVIPLFVLVVHHVADHLEWRTAR